MEYCSLDFFMFLGLSLFMCHFDIVLASSLCSHIILVLDLFILSHNQCILRRLYSALLFTVNSERYFNKFFTFIKLGVFIHQITSAVSTLWPNHVVSRRVVEWSQSRHCPTLHQKYGVHESHSMVPLLLKKRLAPCRHVQCVGRKKNIKIQPSNHQYSNFL